MGWSGVVTCSVASPGCGPGSWALIGNRSDLSRAAPFRARAALKHTRRRAPRPVAFRRRSATPNDSGGRGSQRHRRQRHARRAYGRTGARRSTPECRAERLRLAADRGSSARRATRRSCCPAKGRCSLAAEPSRQQGMACDRVTPGHWRVRRFPGLRRKCLEK